nr:MAG TPA: hypothetical protein [Caudoviricetes sp.]
MRLIHVYTYYVHVIYFLNSFFIRTDEWSLFLFNSYKNRKFFLNLSVVLILCI